jgi:hypothetical protein
MSLLGLNCVVYPRDGLPILELLCDLDALSALQTAAD